MYKHFASYYLLEIVSAAPIDFIGRLSTKSITVYDIIQVDELRLQFKVKRKYKNIVFKEAERSGCQCNVLKMIGLVSFFEKTKKRAILISSLLLLAFMTLFIPTRILFYSVEGLDRLDAVYILDQAERVGLSFGTSRKEVRSEKVKNALLEAVPELKWVGINTYGCRAVISIKERSCVSQSHGNQMNVQGIFATCDGIISSITATKGTPLCKIGQAVSDGQLLISGYTDCGLIVRGESAEGEVRAITNRKIDAISPIMDGRSPVVSADASKWSIQFGKKRIKFYIDSGNSDTKCGRIIQEYKLKLPGGFSLPISVIKDTVVFYEEAPDVPVRLDAIIEDLAKIYVQESMIAGEICSSRSAASTDNVSCHFSGSYLCDEIIGKLQNEGLENLDDRTNR